MQNQMPVTDGFLPAVEVTRGGIVESIHYGALAAVDASGRLLLRYGDIDRVVFLRSAAKPFQALPFIEAGGDSAFQLEAAELALMCASHSGTDRHVEAVRRMQNKVGVSEVDLLCGAHSPYHEPTAHAMLLRGEVPSSLRNNCSGKHTGMLAHARLRGWPTTGYVDLHHPLQQSILQVFAEMCGLEPAQVVTGVDGCSAPNFAVPLHCAALAYARLVDPVGLSTARAAACQRITRAMMAHPDMVAGPDRFDTQVMTLGAGRILAKAGAEGYQGIGLLPGALGPGSPGIGIALKIADGDVSNRARPCLAVELLRRLGALTGEQAASLRRFGPHPLANWQNIEVGEVRLAEEAARQLELVA
jgi:L-asparaginase II